jgi:NAD(P)-dependent dehydrogenase (short-subunit alcohol dehydrogenase family)
MQGKVAIVAGGTGDIGVGVCRALTKAGASVIALDLNISKADGVAKAMVCDLTDPGESAAAVAAVADAFGGVDVLVNMTRYSVEDSPMEKTPLSDMWASLKAGPISTLLLMQHCYPRMKARGGGSIINFASGAATFGMPYKAAYVAAKEAIRGLTKSASAEWGRDNINVNALCPIATAKGKFAPEILETIPMRRFGDPETDIGATVVFLAGPGRYITGRTIQVDGGAGSWK